ncbi:DUF2326 domain-containing protein [Pseudomonas sp. Leaf58]|uniref:DUF2326 domain-containing protein n=1 Tax=Pseudomonas sp. Leaf58 TaxID=1736226 RepID=UPI0006F4E8D0|nr:DUF2326 domain-containing protein [Pseudomonas sp. Leaf58]AYG43405.1 DUF2326 domain-containing protein [Pseudomonas sp. Leaf58]KQN66879.1 chromosome partitioning protein ParA [Pseudomonas sp. Leaf58]
MLKKIKCELFNHKEIIFHEGLNIILGDDDAKNSIGKSSALMVVDFAMGGNSLLNDKAGVIQSLGHHEYFIEFQFDKKPLYICRSTAEPDLVDICDDQYKVSNTIPLEDYKDALKFHYGIFVQESPFRSIVSAFSRIWNKGELDPEHPFSGSPKESQGTSISRLIDVFGRTSDIAEERAILESFISRKNLMMKSMAAEIIPNIKKSQYKRNEKLISDNAKLIEDMKHSFSGALSAYEALFDENIRSLQQSKNDLSQQKTLLQVRSERLSKDISGVNPRVAANIALVVEFFPNADISRLEQIEAFHQKISSLVKKELRAELTALQGKELELSGEIDQLDKQVRDTLTAKGTPSDLFSRVFELKELTDKAIEENKFYDQKTGLQESARRSKERLESIFTRIFIDIESAINKKLIKFNRVVYGKNRNPSQLRLHTSASYSFTSPEDTGTGKSYTGLIGFDLALLSLTSLPFLIHDSVIYKNIEVAATKQILRILAAVKKKQIFLAFDEASKYGSDTAGILFKHTAIKLSHNDLLYTKDWRDKK